MNTAEVLVDAFTRIHGMVHNAVAGLTVEQLAFRPDPEANSIGWLVWHLTRVQDDHVAGAAGTRQVWTTAGWCDRFALPFDNAAIGYGQHSDEVGLVRRDRRGPGRLLRRGARPDGRLRRRDRCRRPRPDRRRVLGPAGHARCSARQRDHRRRRARRPGRVRPGHRRTQRQRLRYEAMSSAWDVVPVFARSRRTRLRTVGMLASTRAAIWLTR